MKKKKKKKYFSEFLGRGYERKMKEGGRVIYKDDIFSAGSFQKLAFRVACSLVQSNRICMAIKLEYLSPAIKKKKEEKFVSPKHMQIRGWKPRMNHANRDPPFATRNAFIPFGDARIVARADGRN